MFKSTKVSSIPNTYYTTSISTINVFQKGTFSKLCIEQVWIPKYRYRRSLHSEYSHKTHTSISSLSQDSGAYYHLTLTPRIESLALVVDTQPQTTTCAITTWCFSQKVNPDPIHYMVAMAHKDTQSDPGPKSSRSEVKNTQQKDTCMIVAQILGIHTAVQTDMWTGRACRTDRVLFWGWQELSSSNLSPLSRIHPLALWCSCVWMQSRCFVENNSLLLLTLAFKARGFST